MKIVFDMDGVLVDSRNAVYKAYVEAICEVMEWSGVGDAFFGQLWGSSWEEAARWAFPAMTELERARIHTRKNEIFAAHPERVKVNLQAVELANGLSARLTEPDDEMRIWTAASRQATQFKLDILRDHDEWFESMFSDIRSEVNKKSHALWKRDPMDENAAVLIDDRPDICALARSCGWIALQWGEEA